jgi:AcrR family transcriptional regulator
MQQKATRRPNRERSDESRTKLIAAARDLFVAKGYAATGTPEIVAAAGLTRGALYHHFADKEALFRAVVNAEAAAVAAEIEERATESTDALAALLDGGKAFLSAMTMPGRTRLLLLDGPAVLGRAAMDEIDREHGGRTLLEGLTEAMESGEIIQVPAEPMAVILSAAFDRAALAIAEGGDADAYHDVLKLLLERLRPGTGHAC